VKGEVSNDTGFVSVGIEDIVVSNRASNLVNVDLLNNSIGGVDVVGGRVSSKVGHAELLASIGSGIPPDKVVLSNSVVDGGINGGCLDGMGVGSNNVGGAGGTTTNVLGDSSVAQFSTSTLFPVFPSESPRQDLSAFVLAATVVVPAPTAKYPRFPGLAVAPPPKVILVWVS